MGFKKKKGEKSRAHNLRAKTALNNLYLQSVKLDEICDTDLIKNNLLFVPNENGELKKVNPKNGDTYFSDITKQLESERKEYIDGLNNAYADSNKAELSDKRSKAKAALKRYSNSSDGLEKDFWDNLTDRLGTESIDSETEITKLKQTSDKVLRFNQKVKRINELEKYNGLVDIKSRNTEYTIFSKEILYKIPDDTDLNIEPMDMANFVNKMNKRLYPDFNVTYMTIHTDENQDRAHAHCEFSGKNLKTGEMDIQQQLFFNLEREFQRKKQPFPFVGRTYNDLDFEEVKRFGEVYQDYVFEEMNKYLNKKGYKASLTKRTAEEKKNDQQKFFDKHKPTQKREYTRAKKLQKENEKAETKLAANNEMIDIQKNLMEENQAKNYELKNKIEKAKEELTRLESISISTKAAIRASIDFAKNPEIRWLEEYKENLNLIRDDYVADKVERNAIDIQPNKQQEEKIRKSNNRPKPK